MIVKIFAVRNQLENQRKLSGFCGHEIHITMDHAFGSDRGFVTHVNCEKSSAMFCSVILSRVAIFFSVEVLGSS